MKKLLSILLMMAAALTTQAADYPYLTFVTTDGAKASVSVSSLTLTVSGTTLTAGSQSFTLSNLSKMYFSTSDETTTGIGDLRTDDLQLQDAEIYELSGKKIVNCKSSNSKLPNGAYIVKTKQGTYKIIVK